MVTGDDENDLMALSRAGQAAACVATAERTRAGPTRTEQDMGYRAWRTQGQG